MQQRRLIMSGLPFGEPPLLARRTGLLYTRHEILLNRNMNATTQRIFSACTAADACQLLDSFRQVYRVQPAAALAGRGPGPGTEADEAAMEESCRFHLRIGPDPHRCTFIVVGSQADTAHMHRTAAALHKILEQYAACRAGRLSSHTTTTASHQTLLSERFALSAGASVLHQIIFILIVTSVIQFLYSGRQKEVDKARLAEHWLADFNFVLHCIGSGSGSNGKRVMAASAGITGAAEASLRRLPLALLTEILEDLDLHTQAHAIRVCALWRAILGDPGTTQHISVLTDSLHSTTTRCGDHSYCCRCAMLLSRVITPKTRSLSLIARGHDWPGEPFNWHILCYVQKLWKAMRLQLPFLVLKAFCLDYMHPEILLGFEDHCDQLIVDGLEMRGTLFNDMQTAVEGWPLPAHEMPFINEP
ncbi:uncharacterized protein LOC129590942 isoform X3 [Paramacrobiotus metropolitanus]|uniref:uncharacterized protein LOC129590942 isoform X3 n=1 Tax=Paramacrobiotus metropolitanus TaxID=2943436 RepID=UPI0024463BAA|nr:uncharacterized protein LOC129590942 isoform X3 [Paramacrobiotus metropolitanus]